MKFDLIRLKNGIDKEIDVDITYSFDKEYLSGTDLLELNDVKIKGIITKNLLDEIVLDLDVEGVMVLPCAITLKPVEYPFKLKIDDSLQELSENLEKNETNFQNTIDILPIIWENILMEIPMRVVSDDTTDIKMFGDGWKLITDEEELVSSPFDELKDLLDDSEVR